MKAIGLLFGLICFIMLTNKDRFDLKSDENIRAIFTKKEIREINKMIYYVDDMVLSKAKTKDIDQAYHIFLEKLNRKIQDSSRFIVPFEEEKKYQFLESLDSTVFSEFWYISDHVNMARYKDTIYRNLVGYKSLELKRVGRFKKYLEKVGEKDKFYKSLSENIELAGDIPLGTKIWFAEYHDKFDFTLPINRLWVVVYILRIEEHHDKKMERYLNR